MVEDFGTRQCDLFLFLMVQKYITSLVIHCKIAKYNITINILCPILYTILYITFSTTERWSIVNQVITDSLLADCRESLILPIIFPDLTHLIFFSPICLCIGDSGMIYWNSVVTILCVLEKNVQPYSFARNTLDPVWTQYELLPLPPLHCQQNCAGLLFFFELLHGIASCPELLTIVFSFECPEI